MTTFSTWCATTTGIGRALARAVGLALLRWSSKPWIITPESAEPMSLVRCSCQWINVWDSELLRLETNPECTYHGEAQDGRSN